MSGAQPVPPPPLPPVPLPLPLVVLLLLVVVPPPPAPPLLDPDAELDELVSVAPWGEYFSQSWLQALNTMADEQAIPTITRVTFNMGPR